MNSIRRNRKSLSGSSLNLNAPESLEPRMVLDSTVVFNELFYHPLDNSPQVEFVEFHNQNAVDVDISQWRIEDGIEFTFPQGTIVPGGGYVVVAADPTAFTPQPEGAILGPFNGRLSNGGERLTLVDRNDRRIDFIEYSDGGDWTAAADGTGVSLAKAIEDTTSQPAQNWTSSVQLGGTPGRANFPQVLTPPADTIQTLVSLDSEWKFHDGGSDLGTAWRNAAFNDASWSGTGSNGPYYAGDVKLVGAIADTIPVAAATASTFLIGHDP
ncbi:MAG: lamin tail domain-containing protein, partial [Planctomycetales bacterium]|nr:lamin tail domain-containing protein [Planctomycetales bacterium]